MLGERSSTASERAIRALLSAFSLAVSAHSFDSRSNLASRSARSRRSADTASWNCDKFELEPLLMDSQRERGTLGSTPLAAASQAPLPAGTECSAPPALLSG